MRSILVVGSVLLAVGAPAAGQAPSPYAGAGSDSVKTLTMAEVTALLTGEGMGLARPAELNGYPGPRHVLDLADSLGLTAAQRGATEALFADMRDEAVGVGRAVLEAERALDAAFAADEPP
ncbi:MAG: hypothetical protein GWM90_29300, partial [Gemmatimonadetes bacterium]|nr:hypothetical protein [Gemmatimonadota bacterium]NIQ59146.1 hypothetical protein [Gemmatimonadota bacterium]NIU79350.1 hypothetical protein [Gammaproteobacteria bacterium]NIX48018.1 hypothetical protein [Gemmatimonadota bacterium]NIY12389.1 hypothetical protein [Gemmatimonadota bacterium]